NARGAVDRAGGRRRRYPLAPAGPGIDRRHRDSRGSRLTLRLGECEVRRRIAKTAHAPPRAAGPRRRDRSYRATTSAFVPSGQLSFAIHGSKPACLIATSIGLVTSLAAPSDASYDTKMLSFGRSNPSS